MAKFITLDNLSYFLGKVKTWVQGLGYQTASQVDSTITGKGYATTAQVTSATEDMATQTWVTEKGYQTATEVESAINSKDFQTAEDVESTLNEKGYQTSAEVEEAISGKGYQTSEQVESAITSKGYATTSSVTSAVDEAKTELQSAISAGVSSVYEPKGSSAFESLPTPAKGLVGDVYNVTDEFTTTESFVEGAGKKYPAGTNVVCVSDGEDYKWDVLSGVVDLSGYVMNSDLQAVTNGEIDDMFD